MIRRSCPIGDIRARNSDDGGAVAVLLSPGFKNMGLYPNGSGERPAQANVGGAIIN